MEGCSADGPRHAGQLCRPQLAVQRVHRIVIENVRRFNGAGYLERCAGWYLGAHQQGTVEDRRLLRICPGAGEGWEGAPVCRHVERWRLCVVAERDSLAADEPGVIVAWRTDVDGRHGSKGAVLRHGQHGVPVQDSVKRIVADAYFCCGSFPGCSRMP